MDKLKILETKHTRSGRINLLNEKKLPFVQTKITSLTAQDESPLCARKPSILKHTVFRNVAARMISKEELLAQGYS